MGEPPARRSAADRNGAHAVAGSVTMLPGFAEGQWWVQDAAAALPARLFGDVAGKTHRRSLRRARRQDRAARACRRARHRGRPLAGADGAAARQSGAARAAGRSRGRRRRRMARAEMTAASTASWWMRPAPRPAPSAATPMSPGCAGSRYRRADGVAEAPAAKAVSLLKPGGTLVYCTCSLEPEEGEAAVAALLASETASAARRSRPARSRASPKSSPRTAICARCPAICRTWTRGLAGSTAFTPRRLVKFLILHHISARLR